jgi:hypothetical protein
MAEWSMAVVLKPTPLGDLKRLYFGHLIALQIRGIWREFARSGRCRTTP